MVTANWCGCDVASVTMDSVHPSMARVTIIRLIPIIILYPGYYYPYTY